MLTDLHKWIVAPSDFDDNPQRRTKPDLKQSGWSGSKNIGIAGLPFY
jgi:hypothetical protein